MTALVLGELRKVATTRVWLWVLLAAAALAALYACLLLGFSDDPQTLTPPPATPAGQRSLLAVAAGAAKPLAAVLGAILITAEYRHRTAAGTFLLTPARWRVLAAKCATALLLGGGLGLACAVVVAGTALAWPGVPLTAAALPTVLGGVFTTAVYGALGVGIGALLRDQVAAVVGLFVLLVLVEPIVVRVAPLGAVTAYLPGPAGNAVEGLALSDQTFLSAPAGALVLLGYALTLGALGAWTTLRRDAI